MQICKTLYLKYILKRQGDSEVEPKLTTRYVVKNKKAKCEKGMGMSIPATLPPAPP